MTLKMKNVNAFLLLAAFFSSYTHSRAAEPMLGSWQNVTQGDIVGLNLHAGGKCDIYIERAYQNRSIKACKYEPFEQRYVVFLVKPDGSCGNDPDFEFSFEPEAPLVHLFIQGSPIELSRVVKK